MSRRALTVALATLVPSCAFAQSPDRAAAAARIDSIARSVVLEGRAVGLSVAVIQGRDTILLKGYGLADLEGKVPTPPNAVYEIASVTKQFTAAAILQLRDAGKLDLDADLTRYLPEYPTHGRRISVRRLLDHTSGIREITAILEFETLRFTEGSRDSAVALFSTQPFDFEPGEAQAYNNSAYILLGRIIEKVGGMSYEDYIEQRIFTPLGMTRSHYCDSKARVAGTAFGHQYTSRTPRRGPDNVHTWPYAAGSLCSSAGDVATWLLALHGGRVLPRASYAEMIAPAKLNDGTALRYGMGLMLVPDPRGARMISHSGDIDGFASQAAWYPDHALAVVVLINSDRISPVTLAGEIAAVIVPPVQAAVAPFTGDVTSLVGTYGGTVAGGSGFEVVVTPATQGISVSVNGMPAEPAPWAGGLKFLMGTTELTFERADPATPATLVRLDGGAGHYLLRRK